jgi:hypothetical protein
VVGEHVEASGEGGELLCQIGKHLLRVVVHGGGWIVVASGIQLLQTGWIPVGCDMIDSEGDGRDDGVDAQGLVDGGAAAWGPHGRVARRCGHRQGRVAGGVAAGWGPPRARAQQGWRHAMRVG